MKAIEFQASVSLDGTLVVPTDVRAQLRTDQPVRVLLLVAESDHESSWPQLTAEQFLKGYDVSDGIYDDLRPSEEMVISQNQFPEAKLTRDECPPPPRPGPGLGKGSILDMAPDFDEPEHDIWR